MHHQLHWHGPRDGPGAGTADGEEDDQVMDMQVENQRGLFLFGSAIFSAQGLLPHDPKPFTRLDGSAVGFNIQDYEPPDDSWVWLWPGWHVKMSADVDSQGWSYAWRFHSKHWHGKHRALRSFVRRRIWQRLRVKTAVPAGVTGQSQLLVNAPREPKQQSQALRPPSTESVATGDDKNQQLLPDSTNTNIWRALQSCRNDREKIAAIAAYAMQRPAEATKFKRELVLTLVFPVSFHDLISSLAQNPACEEFVNAAPTKWEPPDEGAPPA